MSTPIHTETAEEFVRRMLVERTELLREIREANYLRAAAIAHYIGAACENRADLVKGKS